MTNRKPPRSANANHRSRSIEYPIQTLDFEVLQPAWEWSPDPSHSLQRVRQGKKDWVPLEENDLGWEWQWEGIERRGSRKPSLDDYDRWPLQPDSLPVTRPDAIVAKGWHKYERWLSEHNGLS